jgi:hypothetical protein
MSKPIYETKIESIGQWTILRLPKEASQLLPSRGMNMVCGTINGQPFQAAAEPDGLGGHWLGWKGKIPQLAGITVSESVKLVIEPTTEWPEPEVPTDILAGLTTVPPAEKLWQDLTPNAHWEWLRWIRSTNNAETRKRRIEVACSKLESGMRRPCCFNRNLCTVSEISKNGVLLDK